MDADKTVTVEFELIPAVQYQLSASVIGGNGSVSPTGGSYAAGAVVTLTAAADSGYRVKSWSGTDNDTLKTATNTVTMDADKTVTVEFELIPAVQYDLTVTAVGSGSILVDPPGVTFDEGTVVQLTAVADPGWSFNAMDRRFEREHKSCFTDNGFGQEYNSRIYRGIYGGLCLRRFQRLFGKLQSLGPW